ncbi:MAG: SusC/RagA family TonB-linked outer membrane protein [Chitinophagaceae bacterium]|nr:SusC/RagA family TonB-linked outer membrane protein [Chitinophagaceae bacterium]MBP6476616.1 SusC/RagA family TonB-linked outer membrane protein [Chitinophagaceae bacterium]MBP7108226.1 SusC/RagA family TonB-linked outer membrane protein [Chitinophagaceae bacterium]MBP7314079.1 SusC/RagA family TonB-linked outer membrane protein [Chitinophagaceae bacterium]HQX95445.1 SusC/RagA family TonB-linked outer membrane protein [Chitinophagaceae bacterium]
MQLTAIARSLSCTNGLTSRLGRDKIKFWKVMRLTAILLTFACLQVAASGTGQTVTLKVKNAPMKEVFREIQKQTGLNVLVDEALLEKVGKVTLDVRNMPVSHVLNICLKDEPVSYTIMDGRIVVKPSSTGKFQSPIISTTNPQEPLAAIPIKGRVTDKDGNPLEGANVKVKGSKTGTTTDNQGRFTINVNEGDILVVSYIGFSEFTLSVTAAAINSAEGFSVRLNPAQTVLDETVIKGYYKSSRKASTGSIATISADKIGNQPVADPISSIQGRASGVMVTSSSGMPGSSFQVRIRGENSMSNGNEPLYVVDGVPFIFPTVLNQFTGANGNQSPLNSINPGDIERIDILKDADATAIYGSRGANGVILITTKRGTAAESQIAVNIYTGTRHVGNKLDFMNTQQYLEMRKEGFLNDAATMTLTNAPDLLLWDQNAYTDWQDLLMGNTANVTQAQVSFSGGNAQTKFLITGAVNKESTVLLGDFGYTRGSTHFSIDHTSKNGKFGLTTSINFATDKNDIVPTDVSQYFGLPPNFPVYNPDGSLYWYGSTQNPVAYLNRTYETQTNNLIGNNTLRYVILPGLTARANLGYTLTTMKQLQTLPASGFTNISPVPGSTAQYGNSDVNSYIIEPQLDYTKWLGPGKLSLLAGGSWQQTIQEGNYFLGAGYSSDALLKNRAAATSLTLRNYNYSEYKYQAVYGRINYDIKSKYILNLTFRRDGSSRFGEGNKFGNFGAVGGAWVFSDEKFVENNLSFLSLGKLRASYGITGNDQIGDYQYLDSWSSSTFPYGGQSGLSPARAFNPNFSWETNRKLDISLELGFLKDRVSLITSYYNNRSDDQLVGQTLSPQSGFSSYTSNFPALVENKGLEFDLNTQNIKKKNFTWNTAFNISFPGNKLLRYDNLASSGDASGYEVGKSTRIIKGFKFTGVNPNTGVPEFLDVNRDGLINSAGDWVVLGQTLPKFFGGLSNEFKYKNLSLDIFFQFVKQEAPTIDWGPLAGAYGGMSNKSTAVLDRWRNPGDITSIPRATVTSTNAANIAFRNFYRSSDAVWGDASYLRLKNVSLRYDLSSLTKRWKIAASSIYIQGQNLLTFTKYNGLDPEINGFDRRFVFPINPFGSVKTSAMPVLRTIAVGLNISI